VRKKKPPYKKEIDEWIKENMTVKSASYHKWCRAMEALKVATAGLDKWHHSKTLLRMRKILDGTTKT